MGFEKAAIVQPKESKDTVAPRNDMKARPVFVKATIADEAMQAPAGKIREWKYAGSEANPTQKSHPNYYEKYLRPQRIGNPEVGYCTAEPWTVVSVLGATGRPRDDQGKPIETAQRHGDLVLMETTVENRAIYTEFDRLKDEAKTKRLRNGDDESVNTGGQGSANYRARASTGFTGTPQQLLNGEGT